MAYRRKTLRQMSPVTRKLARLRGELASVDRRLANMIPEVQSIEMESQALRNQNTAKPQSIAPIFEEATDAED